MLRYNNSSGIVKFNTSFSLSHERMRCCVLDSIAWVFQCVQVFDSGAICRSTSGGPRTLSWWRSTLMWTSACLPSTWIWFTPCCSRVTWSKSRSRDKDTSNKASKLKVELEVKGSDSVLIPHIGSLLRICSLLLMARLIRGPLPEPTATPSTTT